MSNSFILSADLVNCSITLSVCAFMNIAVEKFALNGMLNSSRFVKPFVSIDGDEVRVMFAARNIRNFGHEF
jgi:hypothetical protein